MAVIAGIDLGTTFSALAALNAIGRPEIVPNCEGERITPSAVYFDEEEAGVIRVGIEALNCRQLNPERSVRWIKRQMGTDWKKRIDDKDWRPEEISSLRHNANADGPCGAGTAGGKSASTGTLGSCRRVIPGWLAVGSNSIQPEPGK